jgi:hypothetical protein
LFIFPERNSLTQLLRSKIKADVSFSSPLSLQLPSHSQDACHASCSSRTIFDLMKAFCCLLPDLAAPLVGGCQKLSWQYDDL